MGGESGMLQRMLSPQVGGAQVTLIAILRSLSVKTKDKHRLGALNAIINISAIFRIFLKFADEHFRSV
jgi:hypothetical protein